MTRWHRINLETGEPTYQAKNRAWYYANTERHVANALKHRRKIKYGLSEATFKCLLAWQNNACAICLEPFGEPHIDHDHITTHVRGLLCMKCNSGLVWLDKPGWVQSAQVYLKEAKAGCSFTKP